ncbi:MAG: hypothetical protein ACYTGF_04490 [Planctomycetota bacterium]
MGGAGGAVCVAVIGWFSVL